MNVYVVTEGHYSDEHIVGVFSDKDVAQEYSDKYEANDPMEFVVDRLVPIVAAGLRHFHVWIDTRSGNADSCYEDDNYDDDRKHFHPDLTAFARNGLAKDREHAIKIAADEMYMALAAFPIPEMQGGERYDD